MDPPIETTRRGDFPGAWHHVMNRGIARRPLFEDARDIRYLLSRFAREVRRGTLEVHAWSILTTHFHVLVRSPEGRLSEAMQRIQSATSRHFNRRHRRDGPLVRGRFRSKPVDTETYRQVLLRYIDQNPVKAGLVSQPWNYRWGSAAGLMRERPPLWHARDWIDGVVAWYSEPGESFREAYAGFVGRPLSPGAWAWLEVASAWRSPAHATRPDRFEDLVRAAPDRVRRWMERKAALADGNRVGEPIADLGTVHRMAAAVRLESEAARGRGRPIDREAVLRIALSRLVASASWTEIGALEAASDSACSRMFQRHHRALMKDCEEYASAATRVAREAQAEMLR